MILLKFLSAKVWPIFPDAPGPPSISDKPPPFPLFNKTKAINAIETTTCTDIKTAVLVSIFNLFLF